MFLHCEFACQPKYNRYEKNDWLVFCLHMSGPTCYSDITTCLILFQQLHLDTLACVVVTNALLCNNVHCKKHYTLDLTWLYKTEHKPMTTVMLLGKWRYRLLYFIFHSRIYTCIRKRAGNDQKKTRNLCFWSLTAFCIQHSALHWQSLCNEPTY